MKKCFMAACAFFLTLLIQSSVTGAFDFSVSNTRDHVDGGGSLEKPEILDPSAIIHRGAGEGDGLQVTVECPPGGTSEGEPVCHDGYVDNTNGGCNSSPNVFGSISSGETICGTSGEYIYEYAPWRDADWFTLLLTEPKSVTVTAIGEFPLQLLVVRPGSPDPCTGISVTMGIQVGAEDTASLSNVLPAGSWWIWVGPWGWTGVQCGAEYWVSVQCTTPPPGPENDYCVDAIPIGDVTDLALSTRNAIFDGAGQCIRWKNIWYLYTATCGGLVTADLCGSFYDTKLAAYEGSNCDPLGEMLACNDDNYCGAFYSPQSTITFAATAGHQYLIEVGGYSFDSGIGKLSVHCSHPEMIISPTEISGSALEGGQDAEVVSVSNPGVGDLAFTVAATYDSSETYRINPVFPGHAYTGTAAPGETPLSKEADIGSSAKETMQRNISIRSAAKPQIILQGGDNIGSATPIPSLPFSASGTTTGFIDDYDAMCGGPGMGAPDVVYSYTPVSDEMVDISLCNSPPFMFDSKLYLLENSYVPPPAFPYACSDDGCDLDPQQPKLSRLTLHGGNIYYIVVDGNWGQSGDYAIDISLSAALPGDDIASAIVIWSLPYTSSGSTEGFTDDYDEACPYFGESAPDVVYSYTPSVNETVTISLCQASYNTKLYVYENSYTPGSPFACNDNSEACFPDYDHSLLSALSLIGGNTYYIVVDGQMGRVRGNYTLVVASPPANDNCSDVTPVLLEPGMPLTFEGDVTLASQDCPIVEGPEVWYAFTTTVPMDVTIDYCDTPPPPGPMPVWQALFPECPCANTRYSNYQSEDCSPGPDPWIMVFENLPPGTWYYAVVNYEWNPEPISQFVIHISGTLHFTCTVECPPDALPEEELCSQDVNGGCNMDVPYFQPVVANKSYCGTAWAWDNIRDTDWYQVTLPYPALLTYSGMAEFPLWLYVISPGPQGCTGYSILSGSRANPCATAAVQIAVNSGTYWLFAAPATYDYAPCDGSGRYGNDYYITIEAQPFWMYTDITEGIVPEGGSVDVTLTMDATYIREGAYDGSLIFTGNDLASSVINVPVHFAVVDTTSGPDGGCYYVVGDINNNGSANGIDVTYGVAYLKGGNVPPMDCNPPCTSQPDPFYAAMDVNGNCAANGIDITYFVAYLKGLQPSLMWCDDCPPSAQSRTLGITPKIRSIKASNAEGVQ